MLPFAIPHITVTAVIDILAVSVVIYQILQIQNAPLGEWVIRYTFGEIRTGTPKSCCIERVETFVAVQINRHRDDRSGSLATE